MTVGNDSLEDPYYAEAISWDADRMACMEHSRRMAWRVAAAGWIGLLGSSVALMMLMPLKRVEPFLVRVDNSTGIVDVVPAFVGGGRLDETVTRYFIGHYVTVCERFNQATAESDYEECSAFQGPERNREWYALWRTSNAASPLNVHRDGSQIQAQIQSISFFHRASGVADLAQVRYVKWLRTSPDAAPSATHWSATIQYAYASPSENVRLRAWNPLGFRVVQFTSEPEVTVSTEGEGAARPGATP